MFRQSYREFILAFLALASTVRFAVALPTSYYATESILSSGKWVKVKVSTTGMQEITFGQLRAMGFSDPEKVAVYGYSGIELRSNEFSESMPDDLPMVPVASYGEKLVFYGVASEAPVEYYYNNYLPVKYRVQLLRNLNNDCSYYFLTDSRPRLEVGVSDTAADETLAAVETAHGLVWKNFTDRHPDGLGAYLFGENIADAGTVTYPVYLPDYDPSATEAPSMSYGLALKALTGRVEFTVDGAQMCYTSVQGYGNDPSHLAYRYGSGTSFFSGMTKTADDIYDVTVDPSKSGSPLSEASVDYYAFSYPRTTDVSALAQQLLSFPSLQAGQPVRLLNATSSTRVWAVTPSASPKEMAVKNISADGAVGFVADGKISMNTTTPGLQTIVFDPSRELCAVEVVGEVASQNYHAMEVPQMLVVASGKTYGKALELAEIHREKTGVEVTVVPFQDICNEFASGLPHPMAIRRFAKMLHDRNPGKFQAILLFARAFNDNTGRTASETPEEFAETYIPMFQCEDTSGAGEATKSYSTDALYGMLSDDFVFDYSGAKGSFLRAPLDIKVGRVPAVNEVEANSYLTKVRKYLDNDTDKPVYNRAMMTADIGDENLHLKQALNMRDLLAEIAPATMVDMNVQGIYNPNDATGNDNMRRRICQQLQRGVALWLYLGHSQYTNIATNSLWSNAYDRELYNGNPPFTVFGTCKTQALDSPDSSLQVDMLFNADGGMIAGVGSTRPSYAQYNYYVCNMMARGYYAQKPGATLGDVYRDGRNLYIDDPELVTGFTEHSGIAVNTMCYNFAGDPMLPMRVPRDKVTVTTFNSVPVNGDAIEVNPLETQTIEGTILDDSGNVDTSFTGELTITIYDGKHTVTTASTADTTNPAIDIDLDEGILQEVKLEVNQGRFNGEFAFAIPAYSGNGNRVSLYAATSDLGRSATGSLDGLSISQDVPEGIVVQAPVISSMYAADEGFAPNDCLPGDFVLYATVDAGNVGLIGSSDRMGGGVSLVLDNSRKFSGVDGYLKVSPDGSASLAYPVTGLADGSHQLTFKVVNVAGESAERILNVNVVNVAAARTVVDTPLAREETVIDVDHQLSDAPVGRLVVLDAAGRTVFSKDNTGFPYTWNLTDNDGSEVADGLYTAHVYFKSGRHHGFAAPARIIVGR